MTWGSGSPLTILHAIARLNVGGAALHVLELAAAQQGHGHRVLVAAGTLAPGEESMEYLASELGVPLRHVPSLGRELSLRRDGTAVRELLSLIRRERPDVVHTHTAKAGATGRIAALVARRGRRSGLVHTFHGHVLRGYFDPRRERVFRTAERLLALRTAVLVAVSVQVRDELVELGVAPRERFRVIPYGFDLTARSDPTAAARSRLRLGLGLADEAFLVGWAGRLTAIKRPLDLIRTLGALRALGVDAALCLVGDGPERSEVEALARTLGIAEHCHLVGYRRDVRDWYGAFDAFCLTSANEGTPVAAIEALAARRPVVATRVGGMPAVVDEGETGFLAAPGDTEGLASRLAELARDPELRRAFGTLGASRMQERYSSGRMLAELEALYREALA